jgi:hypothetical protein
VKKRSSYLRSVARLLLREAAESDSKPAGNSGDSLDAQVDRYLAEYEGEAKSSKQEGKDFRRVTRRLLGEAEDEAPKADETSTPKKMSIDDIDVENFANGVVRMIDNYDSLLEVRSTLARRAINFIAKSYDADVVKALQEVLRTDHGLVPGESQSDVASEDFPAPAADRAGAGGGGPGA